MKLSDRLGKSFNMVNLYVTNKHQPSIPTLYEIAEILDVDVRDLLVPNKKYTMKLRDIAKGLEHDLSLFSETKIAELAFRVVMKERGKDSFAPFPQQRV